MTPTITIQHSDFGKILEQVFENYVEFKLFLRLVNGCIETNNNLTYYDGQNFFINIPHKILSECVITTKFSPTEVEQTLTSKIESVLK